MRTNVRSLGSSACQVPQRHEHTNRRTYVKTVLSPLCLQRSAPAKTNMLALRTMACPLIVLVVAALAAGAKSDKRLSSTLVEEMARRPKELYSFGIGEWFRQSRGIANEDRIDEKKEARVIFHPSCQMGKRASVSFPPT